MKKSIKYTIMIIALSVIYFAFLFTNNLLQSKGDAPTINAPTSVLTVSVKDTEEILLQGITSKDNEDGNLTSKVFVESISPFNEQKQRTVTYAVFDSDDNITRVTRNIKYSDYKEPVMTLKAALCSYYNYTNNQLYKNFVSAQSSIDGDVSSKVLVEKDYYQDNKHYIDYSVTDSCGTKTVLTLKVDHLTIEPNITMTLKSYLKRVKVGTTIEEIAPRSNLKDVILLGIENNGLKPLVEITNDYEPDIPGTYEFVYRISRSNGDYGVTKLVVIVEE